MTPVAQVLAALATVRDPELDEAVTTLGFVASCTVSDDGVADVHLRLPTYFCAPNFAFLMVADAFDAVSAVDGVSRAAVVLDDHFASEAINSGVAARSGFAGSFRGLAAGELDDLRADFLRKAVLAGTDRVCRPLVAAGRTASDLAALTLGDLPPGAYAAIDAHIAKAEAEQAGDRQPRLHYAALAVVHCQHRKAIGDRRQQQHRRVECDDREVEQFPGPGTPRVA